MIFVLFSCRLPVRDGLVDWDSIESIAVPDMEAALVHIRANGELPVSCLLLTLKPHFFVRVALMRLEY